MGRFRETGRFLRVRVRFLAVFLLLSLAAGGSSQSEATAGNQAKDKNAQTGQKLQWAFDTDRAGGLPAGAQALTGSWAVRAEPDTPSKPNALCQTGSARFPALQLSDKIFSDLKMSTRFKAIAGNEDRAAGIIFRIQDKDNFYILRANALEDNVNLYKYANGSRIDIKEGMAKVSSSKWQELRVEVRGSLIRGYLNGDMVVDARDDAFTAGKVGLWTKADSVTCFDDVKVTGH